MASAERTYVDPSALRSLYVHDDRSARFCAWRRRLGGCLPVTRFGRAELVNSIQLAVHRKLIDERLARGAISEFENDVREGRLTGSSTAHGLERRRRHEHSIAPRPRARPHNGTIL